jgi:hypothetical protein
MGADRFLRDERQIEKEMTDWEQKNIREEERVPGNGVLQLLRSSIRGFRRWVITGSENRKEKLDKRFKIGIGIGQRGGYLPGGRGEAGREQAGTSSASEGGEQGRRRRRQSSVGR